MNGSRGDDGERTGLVGKRGSKKGEEAVHGEGNEDHDGGNCSL